jgi:hypothetical protein
MKVDTAHANYSLMAARWQRCRDAIEGEDAIRDGGELYCPKPTGLSDPEFTAYLARASWYGASQRAVDAMTGLIFRKEPEATLDDSVQHLKDMTSADGQSLLEVADHCVEEVLTVGRLGVLVDFPVVDPEANTTVAEAETSGVRPYLATYPTETIINWRWRTSNSRRILSLVVLQEEVSVVDGEDYFKEESTVQYRELGLDEAGFYYQRVWTKADKDWIPGETLYPKINSNPLDYIPFFAITVDGDDIDSLLPPLIDLVDLNIKHWINSAGYEHGIHFTCNPMPVITGWTPPAGTIVTIGSERCLTLEDPQAKAFYMEFQGSGLDRVDKAMEKKEKKMGTLGARLLLEDTRGVEAAETAAIHRSGENSILGSVAQAVSKIMTRAFMVMVEWSGQESEEVKIQLNTDFLPFALDAATVTALYNLYLGSVISQAHPVPETARGRGDPAGHRFRD